MEIVLTSNNQCSDVIHKLRKFINEVGEISPVSKLTLELKINKAIDEINRHNFRRHALSIKADNDWYMSQLLVKSNASYLYSIYWDGSQ